MIRVSPVKQWFSEVCSRPLELLIGLCIFSVAASGSAIEDVASTSLAILFIACLFYIHKWPRMWAELTQNEKLLLLGFALFAVSGFISYINVADRHEYVRHMGRYIRFLLIVPVYLLLSRPDLKLYRYLMWGAIASGPAFLGFTLANAYERPGMPASWQYHHIVFGGMAMLNAMFLSAVLTQQKTGRWMRVILVFSILCTLYASVMSLARGAWLAVPFCLGVLLYMSVRNGDVKIRTVFISLLLLAVVAVATPVRDIFESRVSLAAEEIRLFVSGEKYRSSVGNRLAMWHIAFNVWLDHPMVGTGPGDFDEEILLSKKQGMYKSIAIHTNAHNVYMQSLATTGIIGIVIMLAALFIVPLRMFFKAGNKMANAARLGGIVTVIAFAVFGLTDSWILRAPLISIYLVYVITLSITVARTSGKSV